MNKILIVFFTFFLLISCTKTKTVLICGDHVCINKEEAKQYFEENLTLEVKILDKKKDNQINLVQLNLKNKDNGEKKISIQNKGNTKERLKVLSNREIDEVKAKIRNKKNNDKLVKRNEKKVIKKKKKSIASKKQINKKEIAKIRKKPVNKQRNRIVDVCTILEKCNIDEISKYLIKVGKNKNYPDITTRQK